MRDRFWLAPSDRLELARRLRAMEKAGPMVLIALTDLGIAV
jgi:hypothetical protein